MICSSPISPEIKTVGIIIIWCAVMYYAGVASSFSAGIKCWHCTWIPVDISVFLILWMLLVFSGVGALTMVFLVGVVIWKFVESGRPPDANYPVRYVFPQFNYYTESSYFLSNAHKDGM